VKSRYEPPSEFLQAVINSETQTVGAEAEERVGKLIQLMADENAANRDWATLLLAQEELDAPAIREAFLRAAEDDDPGVRAEALRGLAMRDPKLALPLIREALAQDTASAPVFEAAALVADRSLVQDLQAFAIPSGDEYLDKLASAALAACEGDPGACN
jgi:hypothetical protein